MKKEALSRDSFGGGGDSKRRFIGNMHDPMAFKKLCRLGWDKTQITYQYNSEKFRSIEFEEPHNAIACFGCSHTLGEGVRQEYRWSDVVAKTLDLKCYNFGVCGSGVNSHYELVNKWVPIIKPKAVFVFASYHIRFDLYERGKRFAIHRQFGDQDKIQMQMWRKLISDDRNLSLNHKKSIEAIKYICLQLDIPCVIIKVDDYYQDVPFQAHARDLQHPGEDQHAHIANTMLKEFYNA